MKATPPVDVVRARMQQRRCKIEGGIADMAASTRSLVDWKHYVKTYPWVCLGAAVALGFLIVRKRSPTPPPDLGALAELAKTGHLVVTPAPATKRELVDALLSGVAKMAIRNAAACVGQGAGRLLGITGQASTDRHDSHDTP